MPLELSGDTLVKLMNARTTLPPRHKLALLTPSRTEGATAPQIRSIAPPRPRDCVIELPQLDGLGRRQIAAIDEESRELHVASGDFDGNVDNAIKVCMVALVCRRQRAWLRMMK